MAARTLMALSKTEQRVLAGMRLAQASHERDLEENGQPFDDIKVGARLLQALQGIVVGAGICTPTARKPREYEVLNALQRLVARGVVERINFEGMGGGLAHYALMPARVKVFITNDYSDGHHSDSIVRVDAPTSDIAAWFEETVYPHTGDGHGAGMDLGTCYTAKIVEADDKTLLGREHEWVG